MPEFVLARNRDAYFVIRGFRYQIDLTIQRWLALREGQLLLLEFGEDIDIVSRALTEASEETVRELEQIKYRERNITLRTADVISCLANAMEHRLANPTHRIIHRFCTNAQVGIERPSPFEDLQPAISVWQGLQNGTEKEGMRRKRLLGLKTLLFHAAKPADVPQATWSGFQDFLQGADAAKLHAFVCDFEWSTGLAACPGSGLLAGRVASEISRISDAGRLDHRG